MGNLCIIPARGGSKRIPRKNIRDFLGKPIIAYSIETALASGLFDEVMVSTDDEEIAAVAREYGAEVPFMRSFIGSNDHAPLRDVFVEVLTQYQDDGRKFDYFCGFLSTAPMVNARHLRESYQLMDDDFNAVVSVVEYDFPIERFLTLENGELKIGDKDLYLKRSQDLKTKFHDAGQFYWANVSEYDKKQSFFALHPKGYCLDKTMFFDIDSLDDWKRVEYLYRTEHGF